MYLIEAKETGRHPYFGHLSSTYLLAVCMAAAASELKEYLNFFNFWGFFSIKK
jgi:hypothetical protein